MADSITVEDVKAMKVADLRVSAAHTERHQARVRT